jgi:hypothetical protein
MTPYRLTRLMCRAIFVVAPPVLTLHGCGTAEPGVGASGGPGSGQGGSVTDSTTMVGVSGGGNGGHSGSLGSAGSVGGAGRDGSDAANDVALDASVEGGLPGPIGLAVDGTFLSLSQGPPVTRPANHQGAATAQLRSHIEPDATNDQASENGADVDGARGDRQLNHLRFCGVHWLKWFLPRGVLAQEVTRDARN